MTVNLLTCCRLDCGDPTPTNGSADLPRGTTYGAVAIVACDEGFDMLGSNYIVCQNGSKWSEVTTCQIKGKQCVYYLGTVHLISRTLICRILRSSKRLSESKMHFECFLKPLFGVRYFFTSPNYPKCKLICTSKVI